MSTNTVVLLSLGLICSVASFDLCKVRGIVLCNNQPYRNAPVTFMLHHNHFADTIFRKTISTNDAGEYELEAFFEDGYLRVIHGCGHGVVVSQGCWLESYYEAPKFPSNCYTHTMPPIRLEQGSFVEKCNS